MDSWVYCMVITGLIAIVVIQDPTDRGRSLLNWVQNSSRSQGSTKTPNITKPVTQTVSYTEDGFEDLSQTRTCVIQSEEALSALQRVKSEECRERLTTMACLNQEEKLYPKSLPNLCPRKGKNVKGAYQGCFKDSKPERDLDGMKKDFQEFNSPEICIDFCLTKSYKYAGVQYKTECFCSEKFGRYGALPEWACSTQCPGNKSETCGGANSNRIFSTGLADKISTPNEVMFFKNQVEGLKPVRIAFVLTVYGRAVRQVKRLIKTLYRPYHYFLIHVDSRSQYMYRELVGLEQVLPNLRLSRVRYPAIWAGISLLQGHFSFMKQLLEMTDWHWDYYMNLSESDYPIKPLSRLEWYLAKYEGNNYIAFAGRKKNKNNEDAENESILKTFYECDQRVWRLGPRKLPTGIRFEGGSDWITLHRDFVEYIMSDSDQLVRGMKRLYEFTSFSTESFFHTLLTNSAFCTKWINANLHMINWNWDIGCQCQQKHIIDWCGCSPNDLKRGDLPRIMSHYNLTAYFARKFEPVVSNEILNEIDFHVHKDIRGIQGYGHYWQNEYHYLDEPQKNHDLFMTVANSLIRRSHKVIRKVSPECRLKKKKILESNLMFIKDHIHGYLIKYNVRVPGKPKPVTLEAKFDIRHYQRKSDPENILWRLAYFEVGTNYDVKERLFRNFARVIGPHSEIVLQHSWMEGPKIQVQFSWIDPAGIVAHFEEVLVLQSHKILKQEPKLKTPLRPGEWVVKVTHNGKLLAQMKFIVLPYSMYNGTKISLEDVRKYHNGPEGHYFVGDLGLFSRAFRVNDQDILTAQANRNGQYIGQDLAQWIDHLSEQVWGAQDVCSTEDLGDKCLPMPRCQQSLWSSIAQDPKSDINKYFLYKSVIGNYT